MSWASTRGLRVVLFDVDTQYGSSGGANRIMGVGQPCQPSQVCNPTCRVHLGMSSAGQVIGYEDTVHLSVQIKFWHKAPKPIIENWSFLMGKHLFLGTPHWGFNLDPDPYAGSEMEPVLFQMEIRQQIAAF